MKPNAEQKRKDGQRLESKAPAAIKVDQVIGSARVSEGPPEVLQQRDPARLTNDGVDIVTVKEFPGHANINTTMRYAHSRRYAHSNDDAKRRAVSRLKKSSDKTVTVMARRQKKAV